MSELVRPTAAALERLRRKYQEMLQMRLEHREDSQDLDASVRGKMRRLAQEFPGALREIDQLPLHEIETRIRVLTELLVSEDQVPVWVQACILYHGWMRAVLRLRKAVPNKDPSEIDQYLQNEKVAEGEPMLRPWALEQVQEVLFPPQGRLNLLAFVYVAHTLGLCPSEVEENIFTTRGSWEARNKTGENGRKQHD